MPQNSASLATSSHASFRYLEALNQHRNPAKRQLREQPWSLRLRDLPEHASIQLGGAKSLKTKNGNDQDSELGGSNYVLKVPAPAVDAPTRTARGDCGLAGRRVGRSFECLRGQAGTRRIRNQRSTYDCVVH